MDKWFPDQNKFSSVKKIVYRLIVLPTILLSLQVLTNYISDLITLNYDGYETIIAVPFTKWDYANWKSMLIMTAHLFFQLTMLNIAVKAFYEIGFPVYKLWSFF
jgi:hypothetical protein